MSHAEIYHYAYLPIITNYIYSGILTTNCLSAQAQNYCDPGIVDAETVWYHISTEFEENTQVATRRLHNPTDDVAWESCVQLHGCTSLCTSHVYFVSSSSCCGWGCSFSHTNFSLSYQCWGLYSCINLWRSHVACWVKWLWIFCQVFSAYWRHMYRTLGSAQRWPWK